MRRRGLAVVTLVVLLCGPGAGAAWGHAGLTLSDPVAGSALGATPTAIRLSFSESPQASLSSIRVLDSSGRPLQVGAVQAVPGDPLSVAVRVRRLDRGVYTVTWRVVSAIDGHATGGAYAFGVGVAPTGPVSSTESTSPDTSRLEVLARWAFLLGLVGLIGAGVAGAARFGGSAGADVRLGGGAWLLAAAGLVLLAEAQRRIADASAGELLDTPVGHDLVWRGVALGAAGVALCLAWLAFSWRRRAAMAGVVLGAFAAAVVHVDAGHAASGAWPRTLSVGLQAAHVAAAGVWIGGLAALLLGLRGTSSVPARAAAVRRFAIAAAAGLVLVVATGTARAVDELGSWRELGSTGYGRAVVVKVVLLLAIAALAARNRRTSAGPSRRLSGAELVLAAGALLVAALLGSLAPPAAGRLAAPLGITVSGSDPASTVQVRLAAASAQPGPNRFVVDVLDFESHEPVPTGHVTLHFTPLDDPGVASTSLELAPAPDRSFSGTGANMVFDGRWGVTVVIQRPDRVVRVPLELKTRSSPQFVSIERAPGRPTKYTVEVAHSGFVRMSLHPERAGPSRLFVSCYDIFGNVRRVKQGALTVAAGDGPARRQPTRPAGAGFIADAELPAGRTTITAVATTVDGVRLRAVLELEIPGG